MKLGRFERQTSGTADGHSNPQGADVARAAHQSPQSFLGEQVCGPFYQGRHSIKGRSEQASSAEKHASVDSGHHARVRVE